MSWINDAWRESAFDSMRATFNVDPKTKTQMVQFLLDEGFWDPTRLQWDAAVTRFNACLNPNKSDTFFKVGEVWALMMRFERYDLFYAMAESFGFQVVPIPNEARRLALMERIAIATETCARSVESARADLLRLESHSADDGLETRARHPFGSKLFSKADSTP